MDDTTFCNEVPGALAANYELHGSPAMFRDETGVILAQAIVWPATNGDRLRWCDLRKPDER